ncbi:hypothetical protein Cme02nite_08130 [Catellatospora methionotrophica]|uniref:DUF427 domain-containing protein n=1 Tax=Catellatospora methionotrophica TaxID=121620 RepID=A0A8J3PCI7_9ACTN|nr:DUF427 domain-containing protein [Catellatospora methionotrophica]GIG12481.1 hypothetical protein Cme02nite_08130 [Catellatospora methionotrophica]
MSVSARTRIEHGAKRVRVYFNGQVVADTSSPVLVWEVPYYPAYYLPVADVHSDLLAPSGHTADSSTLGTGTLYTVRVGDRSAEDAALRYEKSPLPELRDLVRFEWDAMDAWFEEDEEVYTHPRDPHTRLDILSSSRHVRVEVDGVTVAESHRPTILFETGLPPRWYLPKTDVRADLLTPTDTVTHCPYKGQAAYWSVRAGDTVHEDLAWTYRTPLRESQKIEGLVSFYNEKVDLYVDGVLQKQPRTKFS